MKRAPSLLILVAACLCGAVVGLVAATDAQAVNSFTVAWTLSEDPATGFEGSPSYCDLDGDGQDEAIVAVGSGTAPLPQDPAYVQAVDPRTGTRLWRAAQGDSGFAQPICRDVDQDGVLDVLTAGRLGDVKALSGVDGTVLWSLRDRNPGEIAAGVNTYSPVSAPEKPGVIFVSSGGRVDPFPGPRSPGVVYAFDRGGRILARWDEPNQAEIYSSPAVKAIGRHGHFIVLVVGSGGETLPGSLHFLLYDSRRHRFFQYAAVPSACQTGGYIASPVIGNLTSRGVGIPEVVAADFCGFVSAFNLLGHQRWRQPTRWPYVISNPLLADVDGDRRLEVAVISIPINPSFPQTFQLIDGQLETFEGKRGDPIWSTPLKLPAFSTPATSDVDGDGNEDIWVQTEHFFLPSEITVYSGTDGSELVAYGNVSWGGSPILNDADGDGSIDALVMDAPPTFPSPPFPPVTTLLINLPGVAFDPDNSYSGFRGPHHDGYRRPR